MMFTRTTKIFISLFTSLGVLNSALADIYIVKNGDTVSKILAERNLFPIYGVNGSLAQVLASNESLRKSKGNLIFPGMRLNLALDNLILTDSKSRLSKSSSPISKKPTLKQSTQKSQSENSVSEIASDESSNKVESVVLPESDKKSLVSHSDLGIAGISEFIRVKASDTISGADATLLSDASIGFRLTWGQNWSHNFRSYLSYQSLKVSIQESSSATKNLTNKENTLANYLVGAEYQQAENLKWMGTLSYGETLVSRALNSTTVAIEKLVLPSLFAGIEYKLYQVDNLSLQALGGLIFTMPTQQQTYDAKLSIGKKIGLGLADMIGPFKIAGEVYYQNTDLKMQDAGYDESNIGIIVGISKEF